MTLNVFQFLPICAIWGLFLVNRYSVDCLHLKGSWNSKEFFVFLTKFAYQQTNERDTINSRGYLYGNITTDSPQFNGMARLVMVDIDHFNDYYEQVTKYRWPATCSLMFRSIDSISYDPNCNEDGKMDFTRIIPCPFGEPCEDENNPAIVVHGSQFTYHLQDKSQPRFWYLSMVACHRNDSCQWATTNNDFIIDYDLWLVNGNPDSPDHSFEYQFSYDNHDVIEIYIVFFLLYFLTMLVMFIIQYRIYHQFWILLHKLVVINMIVHQIALIFCFIDFVKFSFDGVGVGAFQPIASMLRALADCVFVAALMLIARGWPIRNVSLLQNKIMMAFWCLIALVYCILCLLKMLAVDPINNQFEWTTWPGYVAMCVRVGVMACFLCNMRVIFKSNEPRFQNNIDLYQHFAAGFLVWFLYLPILALVCTQVSILWRTKAILSITYGANYLALAILVYLLWPGTTVMLGHDKEEIHSATNTGDDVDSYPFDNPNGMLDNTPLLQRESTLDEPA